MTVFSCALWLTAGIPAPGKYTPNPVPFSRPGPIPMCYHMQAFNIQLYVKPALDSRVRSGLPHRCWCSNPSTPPFVERCACASTGQHLGVSIPHRPMITAPRVLGDLCARTAVPYVQCIFAAPTHFYGTMGAQHTGVCLSMAWRAARVPARRVRIQWHKTSPMGAVACMGTQKEAPGVHW